jgi:mitotic-spindle organizing protein 1
MQAVLTSKVMTRFKLWLLPFNFNPTAFSHHKIPVEPRMSNRDSQKNSSAQQTLDSEQTYPLVPPIPYFPSALYDISQLLNTQLDRETLATCVSMIESGVNPEALAVS